MVKRPVEGRKSHACVVRDDFQGSRKMKEGEGCNTWCEKEISEMNMSAEVSPRPELSWVCVTWSHGYVTLGKKIARELFYQSVQIKASLLPSS